MKLLEFLSFLLHLEQASNWFYYIHNYVAVFSIKPNQDTLVGLPNQKSIVSLLQKAQMFVLQSNVVIQSQECNTGILTIMSLTWALSQI